MRILFLNSGGKDSELALQYLMQVNPGAEIVSWTLEVADENTMTSAARLAAKMGVKHEVFPYLQIQKLIASNRNPTGATTFWSFEVHFKGIQYAAANGFDFIASGHDGAATNQDFEDLLRGIQATHQLAKVQVGITRPLRNCKKQGDKDVIRSKVANWRE